MDKAKVASMLPVMIRPEVLRAALAENLNSDLGGELLIYYREAWSDGGDYDDMGYRIRSARHTWAARCKCTACEGEFYTGWATPKSGISTGVIFYQKNQSKNEWAKIKHGIAIFEGEDGLTYEGVPENQDASPEHPDAENVLICVDGDRVHCPLCNTNLTLRHKSKMRGSWNANHVYRILAGSVENIGPYTALVFWTVSRMFNQYGNSEIDVDPNSAAVIDEEGTTQMFLYKNLFGQPHQWKTLSKRAGFTRWKVVLTPT